MRKKGFFVAFVVLYIWQLSACAQIPGGVPSWQEQYDLGVRYLSEGNYEEAIIAFTAAIEIDPNQALAYVGRGDAYAASGETEENLTAAQADYEMAIELDETLSEAYLGLANVYICQGEYEKALEVLNNALQKIENEQGEIDQKISEIEVLTYPKLPEQLLNSWFGKQYDLKRYREISPEYFERLKPIIDAGLNNNKEEIKRIFSLPEMKTIESDAFWDQMDNGDIIYFSLDYSYGGMSIDYRPQKGVAFHYGYHVDSSCTFYYGYTDNYIWNGPLTIIEEDLRDETVYYTMIKRGAVKNELWTGEYIKEDYPVGESPWIEYITFNDGVPVMIPNAYTNSGEPANSKWIHEGYIGYDFWDDSPKNWFGWACG